MIFDSPKMVQLRKKYENVPNNRVPQILLLDRLPEFAEERQYLEELFVTVPDSSKDKLLGALVNKNESQHIAAWFELVLFGWLQAADLGNITFEPELTDQTPDFLVDTGPQKILVEAKAHTKDDKTRRKEQWESDITLALRKIERPYAITYKRIALQANIDQSHFRDAVINWLDTKPEEVFPYQDGRGNHIVLSVLSGSDSGNLIAISDMEFFAVRPEPVKRPLKEKASKYKGLVQQGYPFVIALYFESSHLSAEEVVEAWYGRVGVLVDPDSQGVIGTKLDGSGLQFYNQRILHKSVSGTLVFKRSGNFQHPFVKGWYVQNPYAANSIKNSLFPVESRFVVLGKDNQVYKMDWVKDAKC